MFSLHHYSAPRRFIILALILVVILLLFPSCETDPGLMAPGGSNEISEGIHTDIPARVPGVKDITVPLVERIAGGKGAVQEHFDPDVGRIVINTTASGKINVTAHLHNARPNSEFFVNVRVRYEDGTADKFLNIETLNTNVRGNGNTQVQVDVNPSDEATTLRRVAVRIRRTTPPNLLYLAVAWDVPLK